MTTEEFRNRAEGTVRSLPETVRMIVLQPAAFFQTMPKAGGFVPPLIFLVLMSVAYAVVALVVSAILLGGFGMLEIFSVVLWPIFIVIGAFVWAAILCVIWMIMGSKEKFEACFRIVSYTSALLPIFGVLLLIPYLGFAVSIAWGTWLTVLASVHVHDIERKSAIQVFAVVGAILLAIGLVGEYSRRQVVQQLEDLQGRFEGLDPSKPEDAARIMELLRQEQQVPQQ